MIHPKHRHHHPDSGKNGGHAHPGKTVMDCLRVLMVICMAISSVNAVRAETLIVHHHQESAHEGQDLDLHVDLDLHSDERDENHDGESEGHHHHLSYSGGVAMFAVWPAHQKFFQMAVRLDAAACDDVCPDGPVFELVKPPQVS